MRVVLPELLGPITPTISPAAISNESVDRANGRARGAADAGYAKLTSPNSTSITHLALRVLGESRGRRRRRKPSRVGGRRRPRTWKTSGARRAVMRRFNGSGSGDGPGGGDQRVARGRGGGGGAENGGPAGDG